MIEFFYRSRMYNILLTLSLIYTLRHMYTCAFAARQRGRVFNFMISRTTKVGSSGRSVSRAGRSFLSRWWINGFSNFLHTTVIKLSIPHISVEALNKKKK